MVKLTVTDRAGVRREYESATGEALMYVLRDTLKLPVEGVCGGCASCGTCHIYVDESWIDRLPPRRANEQDLLESLGSFNPRTSRLSCQINFGDQHEGLSFTLAPED